MARWQPGTADRLQRAALELFASQGFERTTAADIAAAAGVTERTFFRYFGDKRDVVFHGQDRFTQAFVDGAAGAAPDAAPMTVVAAAVRSVGSFFTDDRRTFSRLRQTMIDADPALRERERHKLAGIATTLAELLRERAVDDVPARLAGESGATVFSTAFTLWLREDEQRSFVVIVDDVLAQLAALIP